MRNQKVKKGPSDSVPDQDSGGIGRRIKEIRKSIGMPQAEFAKRIGVYGSHISMIENNKRSPSKQFIIAVCSTFNISAEWLMHGVGNRYFYDNQDSGTKYPEKFKRDDILNNLKDASMLLKQVLGYIYMISDSDVVLKHDDIDAMIAKKYFERMLRIVTHEYKQLGSKL
jgi:transcriptional regulator with XRE-family HTH domain